MQMQLERKLYVNLLYLIQIKLRSSLVNETVHIGVLNTETNFGILLENDLVNPQKSANSNEI